MGLNFGWSADYFQHEFPNKLEKARRYLEGNWICGNPERVKETGDFSRYFIPKEREGFVKVIYCDEGRAPSVMSMHFLASSKYRLGENCVGVGLPFEEGRARDLNK